MIAVEQTGEGDPMTFAVTLGEPDDRSHHTVSMSAADHERLTGGGGRPSACIAAAFRFLLEREPKEAIMERFDIMTIARFFPEFESALPAYLALER